MKRNHPPVYYHVQFLARMGFWMVIMWGVWMVVKHLWWTGQGFTWSTNPFGN